MHNSTTRRELFLINFDREGLVGDTKFPKKEGLVGGRATKHHKWFTIMSSGSGLLLI